MNMKSKALILAAEKKLALTEYPVQPGKNDIVVKMVYAGICGTDWHIAEKGHLELEYPVILGHESVGVIAHLPGGEIKDALNNNLKEGDLVVWAPDYESCGECYYCRWLPSMHGPALCEKAQAHGFSCSDHPPHLLGGWAEYSILPPGTWIFKVPDGIPAESAVLVDPLASVNGVERAASIHSSWLNEGLYLGSTVLVQGAGIIGLLAAVKAQILGAGKVIMIGAPQHRLDIAVQDFRVTETINLINSNHDQRMEMIRDLTGGVGADVVVECAGTPQAFKESLELVRSGGVVVEIGNFTLTGEIAIEPGRHICRNDITIIGQYAYVPQQFKKELALLERWSAVFPFEKLITHRFALEDFERAMNCLGSQECIKAVFSPGADRVNTNRG